MLRRLSLPWAAVAVTGLSACGVSYPLQPAGEEWPHEALVSARHAVSARASEIADLRLRVMDDEVSLAWTESQRSRAVASTDGGRTLTDSARAARIVNARVTTERAFAVTRLGDHTWLVTPGAGAFYDVAWTIEIPDVTDQPIAIQEWCGLVAVVTVERSPTDQRLVLRRYLPPRQAGARGAQLIGSSIDVGGVRPRGDAVIAAAMIESALVAWVDAEAVHLVRVELPDVLCAGKAPRPTS